MASKVSSKKTIKVSLFSLFWSWTIALLSLSSPILPPSFLITIGLDSSPPTSLLSDIHPAIPISDSLPTSIASLFSSSHSLMLSPHDSLPTSDAPPISLSLNDHAASDPSIPSSPQHPPWMLTRSQNNLSTPKLFPDYHMYTSTKYPFNLS
jgi:hypothetical protein